MSKYLIHSINIAVSDIKCRIWPKHFVDMARNSGTNTVLLEFVNVHFHFSVYSVLLFMFLIFSDRSVVQFTFTVLCFMSTFYVNAASA